MLTKSREDGFSGHVKMLIKIPKGFVNGGVNGKIIKEKR
jgi:hypothetical protein